MTEASALRLPTEALHDRARPELMDCWRRLHLLGPDLFPVQARAVGGGKVLADDSPYRLTICAPLGGGKTTLAEVCATVVADKGGRAFMLAPAFHQEAVRTFGSLRARYQPLGIRVVFTSSESTKYDRQILDRDFNLAVVAADKFPELVRAEAGLIHDAQLVLADDLDVLSDGHDQAIDLLFEKVQVARRPPRVIAFFAAEAPAVAFSQRHGTDLLLERRLPPGTHGHFKVEPWLRERTPGIETAAAFAGARTSVVLNCAKDIARRGERPVVIVLRNAEDSMAVARMLASKAELPPATHTIDALDDAEPTDTAAVLRRVLASGIGFLHEHMREDERRAIEFGFRRGDVGILVTSVVRDWARFTAGGVGPRVVVFDADSERFAARSQQAASQVAGPSNVKFDRPAATAASAAPPAHPPSVATSATEDDVLLWLDVPARQGRFLGFHFASPRDLSKKRFAQLVAIAHQAGKVISTQRVATVECSLRRLRKRPTPENATDLRYEILRKLWQLLPESLHERAKCLFQTWSGDAISFVGKAVVVGANEDDFGLE